MVNASGPDHDKIFEISAHLGSHRCGSCTRIPAVDVCQQLGARIFPPGSGRTKKEAEQAAARHALEALEAESALSASNSNGDDKQD